MSLSVIGTGRLGICLAVVLSSKNFKVIGVDKNEDIVKNINRKKVKHYEPLIAEYLSKYPFKATTNYHEAVSKTDVSFIAINTPSLPDGNFSPEYIKDAVIQIAQSLRKKSNFHVISVISTLTPGTMENVLKPLIEKESGKKCGVDFGLTYNPAFIAQGKIIKDFLNPDFVNIGCSDERSGKIVESIYKKMTDNNPPITLMTLINAELTKISVNVFVIMKMSFANKLAEICAVCPNADVNVITKTLSLDRRIAPGYLKGGIAFGGPCFPRDNRAFSAFTKSLGINAELSDATDYINRQQKYIAVEKITRNLKQETRIGILGLSYKPDTDMIVESPSIDIIEGLIEKGYTKIYVHDPVAMFEAKKALGNKVIYCNSMEDCIKRTELCAIITPWNEYRALNTLNLPKGYKIIDFWGIT